MKELKTTVTFHDDIGLYTVKAEQNGKEIVLECLSEDEVNELTASELIQLINAEE